MSEISELKSEESSHSATIYLDITKGESKMGKNKVKTKKFKEWITLTDRGYV